MARSIKDVQAELETEALLNQLAASKDDYLSDGEIPITQKLIMTAAGEFILRAIEKLNQLGKNDTGELTESLSRGDLIRYPSGGFEISIGYPADSKAAKYYMYVDKGVKGKNSSVKAPDSPYRYDQKPPPVKPILEWLQRQGISARNEDQQRGLSRLQAKRKTLREAAESTPEATLAYLIARKIYREGIETTNYFSGTINEYFGRQFVDAVSKAIGQDIRLYIRQSQQP